MQENLFLFHDLGRSKVPFLLKMHLKYGRLLEKRFIFIPGNHKSEHWLLIAIYPKCKVIALFDTINITSQTAQEIVKYILILLEIYSRFHGLNCELNKWKYVHEFDIPKQLSDIDCAVYISTYTAAVINMCSVSVKNVLLARFTIANEV